ncbi:MAG: hypothetical protein COA86_00140 [Kangiella sp.]|nr:MAG: hypothetical protein COA86_00140 [Kangiella sp.]
MSLLSEYRRRNVFKVASVYLIAGWLLLQILDVVSPYLQLPLSLGKIVIITLSIGFPFACILAFLFEFTPNGIKRINRKHAIHSTLAKESGRSLFEEGSVDKAIAGELAVGKLVELESAKPTRSIYIKKLAVLPFSNLVEDPDTNFLGFALADQIIGSIAYSKNVLVRPSSSIRPYQNTILNIQEIGSKLNVEFVLAGSYLKQDETVRLNVELVELSSEEIIWRESIEIKYKNVFELQDIVAKKIAFNLNVHFTKEEMKRMKPDAPKNSGVYDFYLRAVAMPFTVDGNMEAIELLNKSVELDPLYAPLYYELGVRYTQLSQIGHDTASAHKQSEICFLKALSLKDDYLDALANLGMVYTDAGKHHEAHLLLIKALKINPNDAWLHFSLSYHYRYIGFLKRSEKEMQIALQLDPKNPWFRSSIVTSMYLGKYKTILKSFDLALDSPFTLNYLGEVAFRKGDKKLALEYFKKVLDIDNEIGEYHFAASFIAYINGDTKKAILLNFDRESENPADGEILYEIARLYGLYNDKDGCCRSLKKAIDMGYVSYPSMKGDIFLKSVKKDPEIKKLLEIAKLKHEDLKSKLVANY